METRDFQHILLVAALLQEPGAAHPSALEPLTGLSVAELRALAASMFASGHAKRLKHLLRLNRENTLPPALQTELDAIY
jgi:hypothetical protein